MLCHYLPIPVRYLNDPIVRWAMTVGAVVTKIEKIEKEVAWEKRR